MLAVFSFADTNPSVTRNCFPGEPDVDIYGWAFCCTNPTAQTGTPICTAPMSCDDFVLTVDMTGGPNPDPTKHVKISVGWPISSADFDVYVLQGATTVATAASSADPEVVILPAVSATYTIRVVPFAPSGQTYTATVTLENIPPPRRRALALRRDTKTIRPTRATSLGLAPRASLRSELIGIPTFPALKHDKVNLGGVAFFTANLNEFRVSFDDCSSPAKTRTRPVVRLLMRLFGKM